MAKVKKKGRWKHFTGEQLRCENCHCEFELTKKDVPEKREIVGEEADSFYTIWTIHCPDCNYPVRINPDPSRG